MKCDECEVCVMGKCSRDDRHERIFLKDLDWACCADCEYYYGGKDGIGVDVCSYIVHIYDENLDNLPDKVLLDLNYPFPDKCPKCEDQGNRCDECSVNRRS